MNQYYVWPDYISQTINVAKIVYENQSFYVARRSGSDALLCIRRQYLPCADDAAWCPRESTNRLGWNVDWALHLDAVVVRGEKALAACRNKWRLKFNQAALSTAEGRISAAKSCIAELEQELAEQRDLLRLDSEALFNQLDLEGALDD